MEDNPERPIDDEILLNLPFKTVVQLMCTSMQMYNRIRSPEFSRKYLRKSLEGKTNRCLLLSNPGLATRFFALPLDDNDDAVVAPKRPLDSPFFNFSNRTDIVGHSNGLVCVASHGYPRSLSGKALRLFNRRNSPADNPQLAIWNPSLSRYHRLYSLTWFGVRGEDDENVLRLPPSYGFGFNPRTDDYELVQLNQRVDSVLGTHTTEVHIYSLASWSWQRLPDLDGRYESYEIATGFSEAKTFSCTFVNGHMHWLMESRSGDNRVKILAFNLEERRFVDFGIPLVFLNSVLEIHLCGLGESLYFLGYHDNRIGIWRMVEHQNEESWAEAYNVHSMYLADRFTSVSPLLESKTGRGTLFLGNHTRTPTVYVGTPYVQSFLLGDDFVCPPTPDT